MREVPGDRLGRVAPERPRSTQEEVQVERGWREGTRGRGSAAGRAPGLGWQRLGASDPAGRSSLCLSRLQKYHRKSEEQTGLLLSTGGSGLSCVSGPCAGRTTDRPPVSSLAVGQAPHPPRHRLSVCAGDTKRSQRDFPIILSFIHSLIHSFILCRPSPKSQSCGFQGAHPKVPGARGLSSCWGWTECRRLG